MNLSDHREKEKKTFVYHNYLYWKWCECTMRLKIQYCFHYFLVKYSARQCKWSLWVFSCFFLIFECFFLVFRFSLMLPPHFHTFPLHLHSMFAYVCIVPVVRKFFTLTFFFCWSSFIHFFSLVVNVLFFFYLLVFVDFILAMRFFFLNSVTFFLWIAASYMFLLVNTNTK